ncbi:Hypothetical_protein [Hexamita inflata]|uniref:Hypothetical_protein n=1 Tax=Hexamita inflata TaxID=28002 RepID=A0AA86UF49_9EUKA|nr:Hypothetical protein HINF_LOCUS26073 [Hexamita inflata]
MMFVYESRMNYLGIIQHQERLISSKPINLERFSGYLQHGKNLSIMFYNQWTRCSELYQKASMQVVKHSSDSLNQQQHIRALGDRFKGQKEVVSFTLPTTVY